MTRLLLISSEFPPGPGGIGEHGFQVANGLRRRGWDVLVLTSQDYVSSEEAGRFNHSLAFQVRTWGSGGSKLLTGLSRLNELKSNIRSWSPDVVLASGERNIWLMMLIDLIGYRTPWVAVGHGKEFGRRPKFIRMVNRAAYSRATSIICVSEFTRRALLHSGIHNRNVKVIHNGGDGARFYRLPIQTIETFKASQGWTTRRIILTVGRVTHRKGQDIVIHALPHVIRRVPEILYVVVGIGECETEFSALAAQLQVSKHVKFVGRVRPSDLLHYFNAADLFVMPSRSVSDGDIEGFGIAAIEAALCRTPSIVSKDSGLQEAVEHDVTGLHVSAHDAKSLGDAIADLLIDRERLVGLGDAAEKRARARFDWGTAVAAYERELNGALSR